MQRGDILFDTRTQLPYQIIDFSESEITVRGYAPGDEKEVLTKGTIQNALSEGLLQNFKRTTDIHKLIQGGKSPYLNEADQGRDDLMALTFRGYGDRITQRITSRQAAREFAEVYGYGQPALIAENRFGWVTSIQKGKGILSKAQKYGGELTNIRREKTTLTEAKAPKKPLQEARRKITIAPGTKFKLSEKVRAKKIALGEMKEVAIKPGTWYVQGFNSSTGIVSLMPGKQFEGFVYNVPISSIKLESDPMCPDQDGELDMMTGVRDNTELDKLKKEPAAGSLAIGNAQLESGEELVGGDQDDTVKGSSSVGASRKDMQTGVVKSTDLRTIKRVPGGPGRPGGKNLGTGKVSPDPCTKTGEGPIPMLLDGMIPTSSDLRAMSEGGGARVFDAESGEELGRVTNDVFVQYMQAISGTGQESGVEGTKYGFPGQTIVMHETTATARTQSGTRVTYGSKDDEKDGEKKLPPWLKPKKETILKTAGELALAGKKQMPGQTKWAVEIEEPDDEESPQRVETKKSARESSSSSDSEGG